MDCVVTPLKTLMGFSVHLNVQLKFYNLPFLKCYLDRGQCHAIPIDLVEPETRYKFGYFWDAKLTPGFKTVVIEQIQRAIRERILSEETYDEFSENLWIAINSNFITDTSYKKIIDDAKAVLSPVKLTLIKTKTQFFLSDQIVVIFRHGLVISFSGNELIR
ncbi:hypothetical protein P3S13_09460, partial [Limosilactobacillus fermentum]|nr:hypothetical protein [Limosilactobacillus fermentum]MDF4016064.1 hypothetical protein [Limosilactobacillus fermentum]